MVQPSRWRAAELSARHVVTFQQQAHVPIELETEDTACTQSTSFLSGVPAGQEAFVLLESQRPEVNPELVLPIPDAAAEHGARSEQRRLRARQYVRSRALSNIQ